MHVEFRYVAVKPIRAGHPPGTDEIVSYEPGDEVPAGEWGRAADNLVEMGKIVRMGMNVLDEGDEGFEEAGANAATGLSDPERAYLAHEGFQPGGDGAGVDETSEPELVPDGEQEQEAEVAATHPRHMGGGYYELSDGSKIRGKQKAADAEAALTAA